MMELLKQGLNSPIIVPKQVCALYAGWKGFLDTLAVNKVLKFEQDLYSSLDEEKTIIAAITTEKNLSEETEAKLIKVIEKVVELNK
jgi:F-type H+-transporting ATPase subunit alpha